MYARVKEYARGHETADVARLFCDRASVESPRNNLGVTPDCISNGINFPEIITAYLVLNRLADEVV